MAGLLAVLARLGDMALSWGSPDLVVAVLLQCQCMGGSDVGASDGLVGHGAREMES